MTTVKFASVCDTYGCKNRSQEYGVFPSCRFCNEDICPDHQAKGSLTETDNGEPIYCTCVKCESQLNKGEM